MNGLLIGVLDTIAAVIQDRAELLADTIAATRRSLGTTGAARLLMDDGPYADGHDAGAAAMHDALAPRLTAAENRLDMLTDVLESRGMVMRPVPVLRLVQGGER